MRTKIFQLDAFTTRRFRRQPRRVMPLEHFPADALLQAIAAENNLAETAFLVAEGGDYRLRWVHAGRRSAAVRPCTLASRGGGDGAAGAGPCFGSVPHGDGR